jgi:hypothetical protein
MGANAETLHNLLSTQELTVAELVENAVSVAEQTVKGGSAVLALEFQDTFPVLLQSSGMTLNSLPHG